MTARLRTNTSRSRFDEAKRFTGVYQRMGQVGVDADWNEEVRLRTVDARRRTHDLAEGSPDDGFRIVGDFVVDPITSTTGWVGINPPPDDQRKIVPELRLDRHDPETLPWVIRGRWYEGLTRTLPAPLDLTQVVGGGVLFAASAVVFELRIDRVLPDDQDADVKVFVSDGTNTAAVLVSAYGYSAGQWHDLVVPIADLAGVDLTAITSWGVSELPPVGVTHLGSLRVIDPGLGTDVVIRGGDGTVVGAGRMLIEGVRVWNERDLRYTLQPDFPSPPAIPVLPTDGSRANLFYLDTWETTVTALEDDSLLEPALDGVDTTARLRTVTQVRMQGLVDPKAPIALPTPTGLGRMTTNIADGVLPDRTAPEPIDPCRDRCLFTENASTGDGYTGSDNLHLRFEVLDVKGELVVVWSRDNGSTVMPLVQSAPSTAASLKVAPADAAKLRAGDVIVVEDRTTRLRWDAPQPPVIRKLRGVQAETGILELEDAGTTITYLARSFDLGGPLGRAFAIGDGATVRRWDGADLLITDVRYKLFDGITFAFSDSGFRPGDYWTFTARVHAPDGSARGFVDKLDAERPHGPVHLYRPLARVSFDPERQFEDLRRRYLPLAEVRDRLKELADRRVGPAIFTIVVGDGVRSFGDIDQSLDDGITADEALQTAVAQLGAGGGSIFIRAGNYQLEHTVLVRNLGAVRILGDGDATRLEVRGAGGAFYVDRCGDGPGRALSIEDLNLIENPEAEIDIGEPDPQRAFEILLARRFSELPVIPDRAIELDDLAIATPAATFLDQVGARLRLIGPGQGRAAGSVVATLVQLRRLQRQHPGQPLEDVPAAQPLLTALAALPHGVITIADSREVAIRRCRLEARRPGAEANGILITGACKGIDVVDCRIVAATGIAAAPYAPYLAYRFLIAFPRAGLSIEGLELRGNEITATGAASTGIHIADGVLSSVQIRDNQIAGHTVGILIDDAAESTRDVSVDRLVIADNRLVSAAAGIQINGDGIDVTDNEIAVAERRDVLVQAGVAVAGHAVRVAGSWIVLPPRSAVSPLGVCAGVVIGDGLDDGDNTTRAVWDVEVAGNRVDGPGDDGLTIGVLIGGPQAIYDVRIKDNVLRNLGDAAVRSFSTSAPIGRLRVEGNRIERAALADVRPQFDNADALRRLWPSGVAGLLAAGVDIDRPRPLLEALVGSAAAEVRPALDAALRWVERFTLRGAIALAAVDGADLCGNRIAEVGRADAYAEPSLDGAAIRMSAIATVACAELTVSDNLIEAVRAPYRRLETGDDGQGRPEMLELLDQLGDSSDDRVDVTDVHLTLADLRARILRLAPLAPDQQSQGLRGLYGPLDAVAAELEALGGRHAAYAVPLNREISQLRSVADAEILRVLHATRATLSQAASLTAVDDRAQDAWDACAQLDLAILKGADAVSQAARRILARAEDLTQGLDASLADALLRILRRVAEEPADVQQQLAAATILGRVAALHDQRARRKELPRTAELVGPQRTIVSAFVERGIRQLDELSQGGPTTADRVAELRKSKDALVLELSQTHGPLALDIEADFRDVDRTDGGSPQVIDRMSRTLRRVDELLTSGTLDENLTEAGADRAEVEARAAAIQLYSRTLDRHINGLLSESRESVEKSLGSFPPMLDQLAILSSDDPDVMPLARQAAAAVDDAINDATNRNRHLSTARTLLDGIRTKLQPVIPELHLRPTRVVEPIERRLAAVTALAIDLPIIDLAYRDAATEGLLTHADRVFTILRADAGARQRTERAIRALRDALDGSPEVLQAALFGVLTQLDATAELARIAYDAAPGVAALEVLTSAVELASDPGEDSATRLSRVKTYVAGATQVVSPVLAAQLAGIPDLANATGLLREALERVARGEGTGNADDRPPVISVQPEAADGVFAAGTSVRVRVTGNSVEDALAGVTIAGAAGHVVTEPEDDGAIVEIGENRIAACASIGAELRTDGVSTVVFWDNHVFGCAGLPSGSRDSWGQAVVEIHGAGDLVVRNNVTRENGNRAARTILHEIVADWRGEVTARGNTIRHLGGGSGGTGLLILADPPPARVIRDLSRSPFLGVEPAPRPTPSGRPSPTHPTCYLGMNRLASQVALGSPILELGGLRQALSDEPIVHRALVSTTPVRTAEPAATAVAGRYLERARTFVRTPILDFLVRAPVRVPTPRPLRIVHAVQVEGNDISANGPALQILSEGRAIWTAAVVGNELRSIGRAGAVYLRQVDSTVFTGNRCQNLEVVTAVVVRAGKALVTATGNVVLTAQPIARRPKLDVAVDEPGQVSLNVGTGKGALMIPVDARSILGNLERRRFLASDTFASIFADVITQPAGPIATDTGAPTTASPRPAATGSTATGAGTESTQPILTLTRDRVLAEARDVRLDVAGQPTATAAAPRTQLLDEATRAELKAAMPRNTAVVPGLRDIYLHADGASERIVHLRKIVDRGLRTYPDAATTKGKLTALFTENRGSLPAIERLLAAERVDPARPATTAEIGAAFFADFFRGEVEPAGLAINPSSRETVPDPTGVTTGTATDSPTRIVLTGEVLTQSARTAMLAALPLGVSTSIGANTVYDRAGEGDTPVAALRKLVDRVTLHSTTTDEAKVRIGAILTAAGGDPQRALRMIDQDVLGLDSAKPTVRESVTNTHLIAEALADHLASAIPLKPPPYEPRPTPQPAPIATGKSMVLIGGSHVTAVGNSTTAGVLVLEADQVLELNL